MDEQYFKNMKLGIGTWSWGDQLYWGFGRGYTEDDLRRVFQFCIENGVNFFDTAEIYGQGRSEAFLGKFIKELRKPVMIASKFMPFPWRIRNHSLDSALDKSLERLQVDKIQLYQMHMPYPPVSVESWMQAMLRVYEAGKIEHIGVSNYNSELMQRAQVTLIREGLSLSTNQVEYNLLNRTIEKNGLLQTAKEMGIRVIAYSPLAMGILTGKYNEENPPFGYRSRRYNRQFLKQIKPLLLEMGRIGVAHDGKSTAQVAINWVLAKGAIAIPGAKTVEQAQQNLDTIQWSLTANEVEYLDELSQRVVQDEK